MSYAWGETANEPPATPPWSEWFAPTNARPGPPTPDEAAERPEAVVRRLQTENAELRRLAGAARLFIVDPRAARADLPTWQHLRHEVDAFGYFDTGAGFNPNGGAR